MLFLWQYLSFKIFNFENKWYMYQTIILGLNFYEEDDLFPVYFCFWHNASILLHSMILLDVL